jgi:hypothetical protein
MMLPRQNNNAIRIDITKDDDAEDIEAKRREAEKNYGIREQMSDQSRKMENEKSRKQSFGGPSGSGTQKNAFIAQGPKQLQQPPQQGQSFLVNPQNQQQLQQQQQMYMPKSPTITNQKVVKIENPRNNQKMGMGNERGMYPANSGSFQQQPQQYENSQTLFKNNSTYFNNSKCIPNNQESRMDIEEVQGGPTPQVFIRQSSNNFMQPNQQTNTPRYNPNQISSNSSLVMNPQPIYQQAPVPPPNTRPPQYYG